MIKKTIASVVFGIAGVIATQAVIEKVERAESKNKNKSKKKKNSEKKDEITNDSLGHMVSRKWKYVH
jgi:DNA recombination-dependent growth factor C